MIVDRPTDLTKTGTLPGEKIGMSLDENALAHIMSVLTDLYSDPELAVIRELSTNALDSHVEAGVTRPIEIELPGPLAPFFRVKDYGIGMNRDTIATIYSKYGASTKRNTNEQVGQLGLGCKSPLTYTDQFTLTGVRDGVRCQVAVSREQDGSGSMTVVDESETDAPNGVEIIVPVKGYNEFEAKARNFFRFWKAGTVLVNGQPPQPVEGLRVTDDILIIEGGQSYIVMGNVAYPTPKIAHGMGYGHSVAAWVPIGAVNFTPSREALNYTAKTEAEIVRVTHAFDEGVVGAVQRAVEACPDRPSALALANRWSGVVPHKHRAASYTWRGEDVPREYRRDPGNPATSSAVLVPGQKPLITVPNTSHILSRHSRTYAVPSSTWDKAIWITGYDTAKAWSAPKRRKLNQYAADHGINLRELSAIVLVDHVPATPWLDKSTFHKWEDVNAIKLANNSVSGRSYGSTRIPGSFDCYISASFKEGHPANDLTSVPDGKLFYNNGNRWETNHLAEALSAIVPGATVVCVPSNRLNKFRRDFPKARRVTEEIRSRAAAWVAKQSQDDLIAAHVQGLSAARSFRQFDPAKVDDPAIKAAIAHAKRDVSRFTREREAFERILGSAAGARPAITFANPLNNYPLFDEYAFRRHAGHVYDYLNAMYAMRCQKSDKAA